MYIRSTYYITYLCTIWSCRSTYYLLRSISKNKYSAVHHHTNTSYYTKLMQINDVEKVRRPTLVIVLTTTINSSSSTELTIATCLLLY